MLRPLLVVLAAALALPLRAADKPGLDDLLQRSPFGSAADPNAKAAPTETSLELRGMVEDGNELWFSIYEASTKHSVWLTKSDIDQAYRISDFDPKAGTLKVSYQGRTLTLTLKQAQIQALTPGAIAAMTAPPPMPGGTVAPIQPNASETQRLAAIAEEIRRRRALRQNQQVGDPTPPPPPPSPQPEKTN